MKLPRDLLSNTYTKPDIFLCETDKTKICKLNGSNLQGSFKFNSYSEISFDIGRTYIDTTSGETKVHPFYDKVEALRLICLDGFGYFEIQGPGLTGNGIKEEKNVTAYSLEYTLSQKYLSNFRINQGTVDSLEVVYAENEDVINPITLYNTANKKLSLLHLALENVYGWTIGHIDDSLKTLSRQFDIDRISVYDFLMTEVCEKFNCYIVFDTINNTINLYAESLTSKFIGDGKTKTFTISPPFAQIETVSVDGYKTTKWNYYSSTGTLVLDDAPALGANIEAVDGALTEWETDVFVSFDNLSKEIEVSYDADSIKTVLNVTYGDDLDIREANLGIPYLTDLSYYHTADWMGQDLYDAYTQYMQKSNKYQSNYTANSQEMLEIAHHINFEESRLSLDYSVAKVGVTTVGTYYIRGGTSPDYYYQEVTLPAEYDANTTFYTMKGTNLNTEKVRNLYLALRDNFKNKTTTELSALASEFRFMEDYSISYLTSNLRGNKTLDQKRPYVLNFLNEMWNQVGRTPLKSLYYESYKTIQTTNIDAGWSQEDNENYPYYYAVVLILESLDAEIISRDSIISEYEEEYNAIQKENAAMSTELSMENNFTDAQLARLNTFLREDELQLSDIVETDQDTLADSFKIKQDAMESGKIELHKISQPKLQFSASMANIYAIPGFEPIIDQFQLGKVIKVEIRHGYIKQSRLLQVDFKFDDLSSISVEFGELSSLRSQSDIHADLLGQAISAGKQVATNSGSWTKGSDTATNIDIKIQNGLLDAATSLKAIDGTQGVEIDKYGIKLKKIDQDTGEIDPKQGWIVNNMLAYTADNWKTTKTVLGNFNVDGEEHWGLLADAVVAGHVEGSKIVGGTISIGPKGDGSYNFSVDSKGNIVANGTIYATAGSIAGYNIGAGGTYGNALYKRTSETSSSSSPAYEVGMKATDGDTDLAFFVKKSTNSWKSSENTFYINNSGRLYCIDGQIGGWEVGSLGDYSSSLYSTYCARSTPSTYSPEYATFMRSAGDKNTIAIGVKKRTSSSTEWTDAETPFYVRKDGYVFMNNADVTGKITASSGEISGNLTLSGSLIHKSADEKYQVTLRGVQSTVTNGVFYITDKSSGYSQYPFRVNGDGSFTATKATIKGDITATSGTIGGCTIKDGTLQIKNANITGTLSASKISGGTLNCNSITVSNLSASSINTGSLSGSYITQGTVYGNRLVGNTITTAYTSGGINTSLGYANFSNDVFNDRDTAYWIDTTYLTAESVSSDVVIAKSQLTARNGEFYLGGQAMSKQSLSFTDANGNTITIRYVGY